MAYTTKSCHSAGFCPSAQRGSIIIVSGLFHSADLCVKYDSCRDMCLVTKTEGSTLSIILVGIFFPNGEHGPLPEKKARGIHPSEKLYRCRSSAI